MAAFKPTIAASIPIMIGFSNGDAIRNDIADPKGTFALRKPTAIGIVEHAQKGVSDPNAAPIIFPIIPLPDKFEYISSNINQVFFLPPDPTIYFDGELATGKQAEISFKLKDEYKGRGQETLGFKIFINSIGQVWGE